MASINLIEAFQEFKEAENIDRPTMMKVVEDVFKTLLRKKYGSDENFDVIVNAEKGDLEIIRRRTIVEDGSVEDPLARLLTMMRLKLNLIMKWVKNFMKKSRSSILAAGQSWLPNKHWPAVSAI